jgi:hypothetical protein
MMVALHNPGSDGTILSSNVHIPTFSNNKQTQGFHAKGQKLNSGMPPGSMLCLNSIMQINSFG